MVFYYLTLARFRRYSSSNLCPPIQPGPVLIGANRAEASE